MLIQKVGKIMALTYLYNDNYGLTFIKELLSAYTEGNVSSEVLDIYLPDFINSAIYNYRIHPNEFGAMMFNRISQDFTSGLNNEENKKFLIYKFIELMPDIYRFFIDKFGEEIRIFEYNDLNLIVYN